jgi:hypothetical protein
MAAGLAATAASFVTSRFGVAGTLLGAALTAMIITGGSAILRSYMEAASGRVRGMPRKLRARRGQQKGGGSGGTMPGRPDLRDNFVGRMRAALDWFRRLPTPSRRSILIKGLLAAAVAFVICLGVVWGAEKVIGNSLSCGIWAKCPPGAVPGIHPAGYGGTGAGSSISGGGMNTGGVERPSLVDRVRQNRNPFENRNQTESRNPFENRNPTENRNSFENRNPFRDERPAFGNQGGGASSATPDPAPRSGGRESASPGAGQEPVRSDEGQESASPAAGGRKAQSTASPEAGR